MSELSLVEKLGGIVNAKKYLMAWNVNSDPVFKLGPIEITRQGLRESIADHYLKAFNGDIQKAKDIVRRAKEIDAQIYNLSRDSFYRKEGFYYQSYIHGQWQNIINKEIDDAILISNLSNAVKVYE